MKLNEEINSFFRTIINTILVESEYAIRAKQQDAPVPQGSYATVEIINNRNLSWEQKTYTNQEAGEDLDALIESPSEIVVSLNFFRNNAYDNANKVRIGLARDSIVELFKQANLGLMVRSDLRQIDTLLETGYQERFQFDVTVNAIGSDTEVVRSIQSVMINLSYENQSQETNIDIEVN